MKDFYEILGVDRAATTEQIRKAFRKLSKTMHPDVGGNIDEFKTLEEAHRILSDPQERAYYDQHGEVRAGTVDNRKAAFYKMLADLMGNVIAHMPNPSSDNFVRLVKKLIAKRIEETEKTMDGGHAILKKIGAVKKRIKAKKKDNVLAAILQTQIDTIQGLIKQDQQFVEMLREAEVFLEDYDYDIMLMIASTDLNEALKRQASGQYDNFFKFGNQS